MLGWFFEMKVGERGWAVKKGREINKKRKAADKVFRVWEDKIWSKKDLIRAMVSFWGIHLSPSSIFSFLCL